MSEYLWQAKNFAEKIGLKMKVCGYVWEKPTWDEKRLHAKFKVRLTRGGKSWTFDFFQSYAEGSNEPDIYDVLACIQKYEVGTFEQFCYEYGYNEDSRTAERIYKAVKKEYKNVCRIFGDVMDELQEII